MADATTVSNNEYTREVERKAWTSALILFAWGVSVFGWIIFLAGVASLQAICSNGISGVALTTVTSGYMGPGSCSNVYAYTWFIVVYMLLILILTPIMVAKSKLSKFRGGFIGLLAPLIMLLGDASNTFVYISDLDFQGSIVARGRTTSAGAIISSIGLFLTLIFSGIVDEDAERVEKSDAPVGETFGGRYPKLGEDPPSEERRPGKYFTQLN
jgi:hypothetical protein